MVINLTHPEKVAYRMTIDQGLSPLEHIAPRYRKRIEKDLPKFLGSGYEIKDVPLSENILEKFVPLYNSLIENKTGQIPADIRSMISSHSSQGRVYRVLCLFNSGEFIGGQIYSIRDDLLVAAYRVLPHKSVVTMRANLTMMIDLEFIKAAHNLGLPEISIGRDENNYGKRLSIGLLNYKLGIGFRAIVTGTPPVINSTMELIPDTDQALIGCDQSGANTTAIHLFLKTDLNEFKNKYPEIFNYDKLPLVVSNNLGVHISI